MPESLRIERLAAPLTTAEMFQSAQPFPHMATPGGFFCAKQMGRCAHAWPDSHDLRWVRYANSLERKQALNAEPPEPLRDLLAELNDGHYLRMFSRWTGINSLQADPGFYGAGLHEMRAGDWLQVHGDYELHPTYPHLERRLNLILFLNREWKEEWGGALLLCDPMGRAVRRFYPKFGQAILSECGNATFHGVEELAPDAPPRRTVAVYYLAPARASAHRMRAMFFPNRNGDGVPPEVCRWIAGIQNTVKQG